MPNQVAQVKAENWTLDVITLSWSGNIGDIQEWYLDTKAELNSRWTLHKYSVPHAEMGLSTIQIWSSNLLRIKMTFVVDS